MTSTTHLTPPAEHKSLANGYVFGAPVRDLGWFASLLTSAASGVIAFAAGTFLGIVFILIWNSRGHAVDLNLSYRLGGLPIGIAVAVVVFAYLGTFWLKRILRKR
jgi:hypothetical protein